MSKRTNLREFQQALSLRIQNAATISTVNSRLAIRVGDQNWLIDLADISEVMAPPPCTSVPLTQSWYLGLSNIRGRLFSVIDLAVYVGLGGTHTNTHNRLLLTHPRLSSHAALLVDQALGLRNLNDMQPDGAGQDSWSLARYRDKNGELWHNIELHALINRPEFVRIGK